MIKIIKGCKVPKAKVLKEEYEINGNYITANVSAEKIDKILRHFIVHQHSLIFFILELPTNAADEDQSGNTLYKDVYYIDGLRAGQALSLLDSYGELLIDDGMVSFGFGSHDPSHKSEIMAYAYNIVQIWTETPDKFDGFFESHNIYKTDNLVTAWDTFTQDAPGECRSYEKIYSLPEHLKSMNMNIYFAERRER